MQHAAERKVEDAENRSIENQGQQREIQNVLPDLDDLVGGFADHADRPDRAAPGHHRHVTTEVFDVQEGLEPARNAAALDRGWTVNPALRRNLMPVGINRKDADVPGMPKAQAYGKVFDLERTRLVPGEPLDGPPDKALRHLDRSGEFRVNRAL